MPNQKSTNHLNHPAHQWLQSYYRHAILYSEFLREASRHLSFSLLNTPAMTRTTSWILTGSFSNGYGFCIRGSCAFERTSTNNGRTWWKSQSHNPKKLRNHRNKPQERRMAKPGFWRSRIGIFSTSEKASLMSGHEQRFQANLRRKNVEYMSNDALKPIGLGV